MEIGLVLVIRDPEIISSLIETEKPPSSAWSRCKRSNCLVKAFLTICTIFVQFHSNSSVSKQGILCSFPSLENLAFIGYSSCISLNANSFALQKREESKSRHTLGVLAVPLAYGVIMWRSSSPWEALLMRPWRCKTGFNHLQSFHKIQKLSKSDVVLPFSDIAVVWSHSNLVVDFSFG